MQQCKLVDCKKEACDVYSEGWQVFYIVLHTLIEGVVRAVRMIDLSREECILAYLCNIRVVTKYCAILQKGGMWYVVQSIARKHVLYKVKVAESFMQY